VKSPSFDTSVPNVARIYDYLLGGKDNYAADRKKAEELRKLFPGIEWACRENRDFLQRVVRFLAGECGIRQFIDIGTGLPTMGNVHEVAQGVRPESRVVYVDYDRVVIRHAEALLLRNDHVAVIQSDLRTPREMITHPSMSKLIDFNQPVAILAIAVLHFITDAEQPHEIVGLLKARMAPGSYLAISHATQDFVSAEEETHGMMLYKDASAPVAPRRYAEVLKFFDGTELLSPGVVSISQWRTKRRQPKKPLIYGGVGRK